MITIGAEAHDALKISTDSPESTEALYKAHVLAYGRADGATRDVAIAFANGNGTYETVADRDELVPLINPLCGLGEKLAAWEIEKAGVSVKANRLREDAEELEREADRLVDDIVARRPT